MRDLRCDYVIDLSYSYGIIYCGIYDHQVGIFNTILEDQYDPLYDWVHPTGLDIHHRF